MDLTRVGRKEATLERTRDGQGAWVADLPRPSGPGPYEVTAQFINGVGLSAFKTAAVIVPSPAAPSTTGPSRRDGN